MNEHILDASALLAFMPHALMSSVKFSPVLTADTPWGRLALPEVKVVLIR